jgi:hypothetical protein
MKRGESNAECIWYSPTFFLEGERPSFLTVFQSKRRKFRALKRLAAVFEEELRK